MSVSLDGYIVRPDGKFDWTAPDADVFRFAIDEIRGVGVLLLGRRLYETMLYWETADQDPSFDDSELEFAAIWKSLPKVVFSTTLSAAGAMVAQIAAGLGIAYGSLSAWLKAEGASIRKHGHPAAAPPGPAERPAQEATRLRARVNHERVARVMRTAGIAGHPVQTPGEHQCGEV